MHLLQGKSAMVGKQWKEPIDLLFVDGDHSYEGAKLDIDSWLPHLKQGGYVVFHDFMSHLGITRAVGETLGSGVVEIIKQEQTMLVCKKL